MFCLEKKKGKRFWKSSCWMRLQDFHCCVVCKKRVGCVPVAGFTRDKVIERSFRERPWWPKEVSCVVSAAVNEVTVRTQRTQRTNLFFQLSLFAQSWLIDVGDMINRNNQTAHPIIIHLTVRPGPRLIDASLKNINSSYWPWHKLFVLTQGRE